MTQPPPGGYPPPAQNPSGGQPGAAGQPPSGPNYPPPPGAPQPASGFPQQGQPPAGPPPQGQPPQGQPPAGPPQGQPSGQPGPGYAPPPGGYPPPQQGGQPGYPPPPPGGQPGYGPPPQGQQGYPPPGYAGAPGQGQGGGSANVDLSKVTTLGWCLMGASLLTFIFSFFPFWSVSVRGFGGASVNGWSSWWWLPILVALAVGVAYALLTFEIVKPQQLQPLWLFYAGAASFVLMIFVLIHTIARGAGTGLFTGGAVSTGPSFGTFAVLVTTLAVAYFAGLYAQSAGTKLPFKLPGPAKM